MLLQLHAMQQSPIIRYITSKNPPIAALLVH